jgi:hypothetical protein
MSLSLQSASVARQLSLFLSRRLPPWWWRQYVLPKRRFLQEPHGDTFQKTAFFIVLLNVIPPFHHDVKLICLLGQRANIILPILSLQFCPCTRIFIAIIDYHLTQPTFIGEQLIFLDTSNDKWECFQVPLMNVYSIYQRLSYVLHNYWHHKHSWHIYALPSIQTHIPSMVKINGSFSHKTCCQNEFLT